MKQINRMHNEEMRHFINQDWKLTLWGQKRSPEYLAKMQEYDRELKRRAAMHRTRFHLRYFSPADPLTAPIKLRAKLREEEALWDSLYRDVYRQCMRLVGQWKLERRTR